MTYTPGIYSIPLPDYIADPAPEPSLSASIAHTLITKSPLHAWMKHPRLNPRYEREDSNATDIGTIAHALLLEDDHSRIVVIDAEDWRTKAAKEARDIARACGKLPVLMQKMGQIEAMVKAARAAIAVSEVAEIFKEGKKEQTLIWQEDNGVWCRSRPDVLHEGSYLLDYKTTQGSAEPTNWMRNVMLPCGNAMQAALGMVGANHLFTPQRYPTFIFMVQETEPPYAMSFVGLSPQFCELAGGQRKHATGIWHHCTQSGAWPGYPSRIAYLEPPAWLAMEQTNVPVMEEHSNG